MIVVDTSALMAVLLEDPVADECADHLAEATSLAMSAGTMAECLIVAGRRGVRAEMERLIEVNAIEVVPVSSLRARRVADDYARWGKGVHPAGLNYGDCFAYSLAREYGAPLLFVGEDFARTDIASAREVPARGV